MRRIGYALFVALALCIALASAVAYVVAGDRALPRATTNVVVPNGASARAAGALLRAAGVVRSARAFDLYVRARGLGAKISAGEFSFAPHRTLAEVVTEVTGIGTPVARWVTIPEGFTDRQIARTLADRGFGADAAFERYFATTSLRVFGIRTPSLEGYLFPDTYLVPVDATPASVAQMMTARFFAVLPSDARALAARRGLDVPQVVTLASLVEREAEDDAERPLMAGVYYNRLRLGMPLQVDATIEYTFAQHKAVITYADLASDSPYNTYKHRGLPPTPIANPGRASLLAAFRPQNSDYLYYLYAGHGRSVFSRTLAEHEANVRKYLH